MRCYNYRTLQFARNHSYISGLRGGKKRVKSVGNSSAWFKSSLRSGRRGRRFESSFPTTNSRQKTALVAVFPLTARRSAHRTWHTPGPLAPARGSLLAPPPIPHPRRQGPCNSRTAVCCAPSAYIDGAWIDADDRRRLRGPQPRRMAASLASVPDLGAAETRRAIEAAAGGRAAGHGGRAPPRSAPRSCGAWFELIMAHQEDLAVLMTSEQGKPLAEARGEVAYGAVRSSSGSPRRPSASMAT